MFVGKILEGTLQGRWQNRKPWQQCYIRTPKDEGVRNI